MKSPFETLSPIFTLTDSILPSSVEGTSTLDLSLSKVINESFFMICLQFYQYFYDFYFFKITNVWD